MSRIIALGGYAGAGKDSVGDHLVNRYGFRRFAHADVLRDLLIELDPFVDGTTRASSLDGDVRRHGHPLFGAEAARLAGELAGDLLAIELGVQPVAFDHATELVAVLDPLLDGATTARQLVAHHGWDAAKRHRLFGPEVRRLLQVLGTEVLRGAFGDDLLVNVLIERVATTWAQGGEVCDVVITDARGDTEAAVWAARGAQVWWVERPGTGRANDHPTEAPISEHLIDTVLLNDKTLADLASTVDRLIDGGHAAAA